jgi:hypothetical protein
MTIIWCSVDGALTIDTQDRLHVVCSCIPDSRRHLKNWGDPALEVFHLRLDPRTGTCEVTPLSPPDPSVANWLPTISHAGPFQPVENPVILYTRGVPGEGCKAPDLTEVWCVWAEENT